MELKAGILSVVFMILPVVFTQGIEVSDTCTVDCLWIADGYVGTCASLLDSTTHPSIYTRRKWYCSYGFTRGCQATCATIMNEPSSPTTTAAQQQPTTTTTTTTTAPSVTTVDPSCTNSVLGVHLMDGGYDCKYLVKFYPEDQIRGIYQSRVSICSRSTTNCCHSCRVVANENTPIVPPTSASDPTLLTSPAAEKITTTQRARRATTTQQQLNAQPFPYFYKKLQEQLYMILQAQFFQIQKHNQQQDEITLRLFKILQNGAPYH